MAFDLQQACQLGFFGHWTWSKYKMAVVLSLVLTEGATIILLSPGVEMWTMEKTDKNVQVAVIKGLMGDVYKLIPGKKVVDEFGWNFLPSTVEKKSNHHACLRDVMGQSCTIYACTCANHVHFSFVLVIFCGSWKCSLSSTWGKTQQAESVERVKQFHIKFVKKITPCEEVVYRVNWIAYKD